MVEPRRGYGYACAAGVAAASGDLLAFMDGDGSFVPGELAALLVPMLDGSADLVLGTRMRGAMAAGAMPPHQRFGNQLVARLVATTPSRPKRKLGTLKGTVLYMAPDFDAPLEDFKEYME